MALVYILSFLVGLFCIVVLIFAIFEKMQDLISWYSNRNRVSGPTKIAEPSTYNAQKTPSCNHTPDCDNCDEDMYVSRCSSGSCVCKKCGQTFQA